eukprot:Hpha_TRINITY_DN9782_c0_g1::TRINITY_DN9782_c0_g1_i1::g.10177::m.10177
METDASRPNEPYADHGPPPLSDTPRDGQMTDAGHTARSGPGCTFGSVVVPPNSPDLTDVNIRGERVPMCRPRKINHQQEIERKLTDTYCGGLQGSLKSAIGVKIYTADLGRGTLGDGEYLFECVRNGDASELKGLLTEEENRDCVLTARAGGLTALMWAAATGGDEDVDVVAALLPYSCVNAKDSDGWTAFHWCTALGHFKKAGAILDNIVAQQRLGSKVSGEWYDPVWESHVKGDQGPPVPVAMLSRCWKTASGEYTIEPQQEQKVGDFERAFVVRHKCKPGGEWLMQVHKGYQTLCRMDIRSIEPSHTRGTELNRAHRITGRNMSTWYAYPGWYFSDSGVELEEDTEKPLITPKFGPTPLHWAYLHGDFETVQRIEDMADDLLRSVTDTLGFKAEEYLIQGGHGKAWLEKRFPSLAPWHPEPPPKGEIYAYFHPPCDRAVTGTEGEQRFERAWSLMKERVKMLKPFATGDASVILRMFDMTWVKAMFLDREVHEHIMNRSSDRADEEPHSGEADEQDEPESPRPKKDKKHKKQSLDSLYVRKLLLQCACVTGDLVAVRRFIWTESSDKKKKVESRRLFLMHSRLDDGSGKPSRSSPEKLGDSAFSLAAATGHPEIMAELVSGGIEAQVRVKQQLLGRSLARACYVALRNAREETLRLVMSLNKKAGEFGLFTADPIWMRGATTKCIRVAIENSIFPTRDHTVGGQSGGVGVVASQNLHIEDLTETLPDDEFPGETAALVVLRAPDDDAEWEDLRGRVKEAWESLGSDSSARVFSLLLVDSRMHESTLESGTLDDWAKGGLLITQSNQEQHDDRLLAKSSIIKGDCSSLLMMDGRSDQPALDWLHDNMIDTLYFVGTGIGTKIRDAAMSAVQEGFNVFVVRDLCDGDDVEGGDFDYIREVGGTVCVARHSSTSQHGGRASKKRASVSRVILKRSARYKDPMEETELLGDDANKYAMALYRAKVFSIVLGHLSVRLPYWMGVSVQKRRICRGLGWILRAGVDPGLETKAGELFITLAGVSRLGRTGLQERGFTAGGCVFRHDHLKWIEEGPLHVLIIRNYHHQSGEGKLLLDLIQHLNALSQTIPEHTKIVCHGGPADVDGMEGEVVYSDFHGVDVRFPVAGVRRGILRHCIKLLEVIPVEKADSWQRFREGWWWRVATVAPKMEWLRRLEASILAGEGSKKPRVSDVLGWLPDDEPITALTLASILGDHATVKCMVGEGAGLTVGRLIRGKDSAGTDYEADRIRDLWLCTPNPDGTWEHNEPDVPEKFCPVLHRVLSSIRNHVNSGSGENCANAAAGEANNKPLGGNKYLRYCAEKDPSIEGTERGAQGLALLGSAAFVENASASQTTDMTKVEKQRYKGLVKVADVLLRSAGLCKRRLCVDGTPTDEVVLTSAEEGEKKIVSLVDRAGLLRVHKRKTGLMESGLGILLQCGSQKLLDTVLELKFLENCEYDGDRLSHLVENYGASCLLKHRHLWSATHGGHETLVLDSRLSLAHWATLRGSLGLMTCLMTGAFDSKQSFLRKTSGDCKDPSYAVLSTNMGTHDHNRHLECKMSSLGYSVLHYACYSGSVHLIGEILDYVNESAVFTADDLLSFINFQARPTGVESMGFSELLQTDVEWISQQMVAEKGVDVRSILARCKKVSVAGDTALHVAAQFNNVACAAVLLARGANVLLCNSVEGLDPHDITLVLQQHHRLCGIVVHDDGHVDAAGCCSREPEAHEPDHNADDIEECILSMLEVYRGHDSTHEALLTKLGKPAWSQFFWGRASLYIVFLFCLTLSSLLYLRGSIFFGANSIESLIDVEAIGDADDLAAYITGDFSDLLFGGAGDGYNPLYGVYQLVGALRIATLRTSEGTCESNTVRIGGCWGGWSDNNNNATPHGGSAWE